MTDLPVSRRLSAERFTTFVDAVVAIAMTLLILPLLEAVSEASDEGLDTGSFLAEHAGQMLSFGLSFVLIATFWMEHHRLYNGMTGVTPALLWINVAWMLTIVWLPVPTAMLSQMTSDALQAVMYIGTLILTQVTTLGAKLYLVRHPGLVHASADVLRQGAIGDIAASVLFAAALIIAAWVHSVGYLALLLVALTGPLQRMLVRAGRGPGESAAHG